MPSPASNTAPFGAYAGPWTPLRSRPWALVRMSWRQVRASRLLMIVLSAAVICWLVFAILIYLHFNTGAITILQIAVQTLAPVNAKFFVTFLGIEALLAFFLTLILIPPLFSRDLAHNALPLYLSRPISKLGYVWGKLALSLGLLSLVTWVPGLILFALQSGLAGHGWARAHAHLGVALFFGSWIWLALMALPAAAISTWARRRLPATGALLAWFFVPGIVAGVVDHGLITPWGTLLSPLSLTRIAWRGLFHLAPRTRRPMFVQGRVIMLPYTPVPSWCAYLVIGAICLLCAAILWRRLRPLRGVRG